VQKVVEADLRQAGPLQRRVELEQHRARVQGLAEGSDEYGFCHMRYDFAQADG